MIDDHREALASGPDLPRPLAEALEQSGLTRLWLPRVLGGPETEPCEFVEAIEALARLDGAVAWCALISSAGSRFAGLMAAEPMSRLMPAGGISGFSGSGHPDGSATPDGRGWRISGRRPWASFCRHSTISFLMCVEQENGSPRRTADGKPVLRGVLLPSETVRVLGDWDGDGLRSSGSHDVACTDAWVPDDCTTGIEFARRQPGPLYQIPMTSAFAIAVMGVPLGIAAASIDALASLARTKVAFMGAAPIREQEHVQCRPGRPSGPPIPPCYPEDQDTKPGGPAGRPLGTREDRANISEERSFPRRVAGF